MEVSVETLRKTIGGISDEDLLRRWGAQLFTEEALPIAEAELTRRGLDFSFAHIEKVQAQLESEIREARSIRYVQSLSSVIVGVGCLAFAARLGIVGGAIGGAIAWPIGTRIAKAIDRRVDATWARLVLGFLAFIIALLASLIVSLLVGGALSGRA